ncbi:MAG: sigma-54 interaction domain-containing protein [Alphaproteobacteria bacterium]
MTRVLVVGRTGRIEDLLKRRFSAGDIQIDSMADAKGVLSLSQRERYHIVFFEALRLEPDLLRALEHLDLMYRKHANETRIFVVGDETDQTLNLDRLGGHATFVPWQEQNEICALVSLCANSHPAADSVRSRDDDNIPVELEGMLGVSLPMRELFERTLQAASTDIAVLITGETGTGKDLVAAAIHKRSQRKNGPYVAVNTGAVPLELIGSELFGHEKGSFTGAIGTSAGRFEEADGGTIFLDEIATMDEKLQISLLRVLETKTFRRVGGKTNIHVDVRVIAATNENLEKAVKERRFREDLYYRLDVFHIQVPPLRERPGGVTLLASHYVPHFNRIYGKRVRTIAPETLRLLRRYPWRGNVRELKNVIQRAVLMAKGEALTPDLLPPRIIAATTDAGAERQFPIQVGMTLDAAEKEFIRMTLASTGGKKTEAAVKLGISRRALYNKLQKYGLS